MASFFVPIQALQVLAREKDKISKENRKKSKMATSRNIRWYFEVQHLNNKEDPEEEKSGSVIVIDYMKL